MNRRRMMMESKIKLNYLEAIDGAYIDTEYIPTDNTAFEFEAAFNTTSNIYYGCITRGTTVKYNRFHGGAEKSPVGGTDIGVTISAVTYIKKKNDEKYHVYYISKNLGKLDEIEQQANLEVPNISIYIMNRHSVNVGTTTSYITNRCRYAKIYENGDLVRHFVPSFNNGLYCMYEIVQGKYYYNASETGSFTGGVD